MLQEVGLAYHLGLTAFGSWGDRQDTNGKVQLHIDEPMHV